MLRSHAEALDQPVADRKGRSERDLLRGDRGDEALEGLDRDRRSQPAELRDEAGERRVARGESVERVEVELGAEQLANHGLDARVEGLDVGAALD